MIALGLPFPFEAYQPPAGALAFTEIAQVQRTIECFPDPFRFGHYFSPFDWHSESKSRPAPSASVIRTPLPGDVERSRATVRPFKVFSRRMVARDLTGRSVSPIAPGCPLVGRTLSETEHPHEGCVLGVT